MNDKETIEILMGLLNNGKLNPEEKAAILSAIGILSWSKLAESRIKRQKSRKDRGTEE